MPPRRKSAHDSYQQPPRLLIPRAEAAAKIQAHLDRGMELRKQLSNQSIRDHEQLEQGERQMWRWSDYTKSLLEGLFDNRSVADSTRMIPMGGVSDAQPLSRAIQLVDREWESRLSTVQSVLERLDTYQEQAPITTPIAGNADQGDTERKVFIVHGHDEGAKDAVARTLDRLKVPYTILHEQPNRGQTVMEKFERHAEAGFAVVLLTPDDVGAPNGQQGDLKPRARQNVVFELGFFYGKLGRENVCALTKGVESPSDIAGVLYTQMDPGGVWRYKLAQELDTAGLRIDMNLLKGM